MSAPTDTLALVCEHLADDLASRYTLIMPDLLGFGFSSKPSEGYALHRHVAAVAAVLRHSGHAHARAVVGHSCGGVVALGLLASGLLRAEHVVMGTDYPFPWTSTEVDLVMNTPDLTDEQRAAILGRTTERLLGIA